MARFTSVGKGESINLKKAEEQFNSPLVRLHVGLGWDFNKGKNADLDAFIVQLGANDQLIEKIYFGNKTSHDRAILHGGDNLTGEGEGDDEVVLVDLSKLNPNTKRLIIGVNIYTANLTFNEVKNAFMRLVNQDNEEPIARYDLSNEFGNNYTMVMGEFIKLENGTWDFKAVGEGTKHKSIGDYVDFVSTGKFTDPNAPQKKGLFGKLFG